jgi:uncharacterized protein YecT (DUF1311 family)
MMRGMVVWRTFLATVVVGAAAMAAAWAQPATAPASADSHAACMDRAAGVTAAMSDCIAADLQRQDVRLNEAYRALRESLAPARRTALQRAQRDWLRFRDSHCAFLLDPEGGTLARVSSGDCRRRMTELRADELQALGTER